MTCSQAGELPTGVAAEPGATTAPGSPHGERARAEMRGDSLGLLLAYLVCLVGIPSVLIFGPLGAAGTPAGVLADVLLVIAGASRLLYGRRPATPVTWLLLLFAVAIVASYVVGAARPSVAAEMSGADRGLLVLAGWAGLVLVVSNGLSTPQRLDRFLRALTFAGGALAVVGLLQYFFGINIATFLRFPGLTANDAFGGLGERQGFTRISGTARHPIEFGAVLTLVLPIGLHYSLHGRRRRRRMPRLAVALMGFAIPLTVARSAILGIAVVLGLLFWTWTPRQQLKALVLVPLGLAVVKVAAPQLLGTLTHLFTSAQNDPSVQNRLGDYTTAGYYVTQSPFLGRGFFTFAPEIYRTFDNQYLGILVECGVVGLVAALTLIVGSGLTALDVRSHSRDAATRSLGMSLAVSMAVGLATFSMFDAYAFPMVMGVFFILVGSVGCLWRLHRRQVPAKESSAGYLDVRSRAMALAIVGALALSGLGLGIRATRQAPVYQAVAIAYLSAPSSTTLNRYQHTLYLGDLPELLRGALIGPQVRAELGARGITGYEVVRQGGSLAHGTEDVGSGDFLTIGSLAGTPERAIAVCRAVLQEASDVPQGWQRQARANPDAMIGVRVSTAPAVGEVHGSAKRVDLGLALLVMLLAPSGYTLLARRLSRRRTLLLGHTTTGADG